MKRLTLATIFVVLGIWMPQYAHAATISLSASDTTISVGDTVTITVRVSAGGQAINAADGALVFPRSNLTLQSISRSGSIFTFWAEEPHGSNTSGQISFSGGLPTPGFSGSSGKIFQATFKAKAVGAAPLTISGGHILANDGFGTNVYTGAGTSTITISETATTPVEPSAPGEPSPVVSLTNFINSNSWYTNGSFTASWSKPKNYQGTSIVLDQIKTTVPPTKISTTSSSADYSLTANGIWFLHLRHSYTTGWSGTTTVILRFDNEAPEPFTIHIDRDRGDTDPTPVLTFTTKDGSSGVAKYTLELDGSAAQVVSSPYTLKGVTGDGHTIRITAIDQAGNSRVAETTIGITGYPAPQIKAISSPIVLLDTLTVRGTAQAGDMITIYLDDQVIGQTYAGKENEESTKAGAIAQLPFFFISDRIIKPGRHTVTAVATADDGRKSVASDPAILIVTGTSISIGGRPIATVALAPVAGIVIILFIFINTGFLIRIWLSFRHLYQREVTVEEELEALRRRLGRERVSTTEIDQELYTMELELTGRNKRSTPKKTRKKR